MRSDSESLPKANLTATPGSAVEPAGKRKTDLPVQLSRSSIALEILPTLQGPEDLRDLPAEQLPQLATEIRQVLNEVVAQNGGHLSSNLGVTDLTIALHRVFDFLHDRLIFDVGHQVYVHKLLTGRFERFATLRQWDGISGFPDPREGPYDLFRTAHASAAISTALGLAIGDEAAGEQRHTIAVVGDGAMAGGLAFEGLNQSGHLKAKRLIIILNDNEMTISPTVGALQKYLSKIRTGSLYNTARERLHHFVQSIPMVGEPIDRLVERSMTAISEFIQPGQIFRELGFRYFGPIDGHDLDLLIETLRNLRQLDGPVLLHAITCKGSGIPYATRDPEKFHSPAGYQIPICLTDPAATRTSEESYSKVFVQELIEQARGDERICAITAAMPSGTGLIAFEKEFPKRYFDVGICEQHAVAFTAGLARSGRKPVTCIYSTFLQRALDQVFQELALQGDLPAVIGVDRGGLVGGDGPMTHGVFDIAFLRALPNLVLMSPKDGPELRAMLRWALASERIVALRYPRDTAMDLGSPGPEIELGRGEIIQEGEDAAILVYGPHSRYCLEAAEILEQRYGIRPTLASARFAKPVDAELAASLLARHRVVATVEDHALLGGFGSAVLEAVSERSARVGRLLRIGIPDRFIPHGSRDDCLRDAGIDAVSIAEKIYQRLSSGRV